MVRHELIHVSLSNDALPARRHTHTHTHLEEFLTHAPQARLSLAVGVEYARTIDQQVNSAEREREGGRRRGGGCLGHIDNEGHPVRAAAIHCAFALKFKDYLRDFRLPNDIMRLTRKRKNAARVSALICGASKRRQAMRKTILGRYRG